VTGDREKTIRTSSSNQESTSTFIAERLTTDEESAISMLETDGQFSEPSQQLRDTSDPAVYYALLNGRALNAPHDVDGKPMAVHTRAALLEQSSLGGVAVYRLQVVSSSGWSANSGIDTTLVASIRCSDYLPLMVEGVQRSFEIDRRGKKMESPDGQRWVTRYLAMESLPQARVPANAFQLHLPAGSITHSSAPVSASKVASSVPFPVFWLSKSFEELRFVGSYRRTENEVEYSSHANVDNAMIDADHNRPKISGLQVGAEYSPSGRPANRDKHATTPGIKVVSMPRTDPATWEKSMKYTLGSLNGSPSTSPTLRWTTVGGRRALHLRREWLWGRGENAPPGQVKWTCDYLVIDYGNATVMLQAVFLKRGEVERAARALRVVQ
jgi:hypothetical protein